MLSSSTNSNNLNLAVTTTADNSGLSAAEQAVENYAAKLEVLRQKMLEASAADNTKQSSLMALKNQYDVTAQKFDEALNKAEAEKAAVTESSGAYNNLAGELVTLQAVYNSLMGFMQNSINLLKDSVDQANKYQQALGGLDSTARSMGDGVDQATEAAKKLSSNGLIPVTQSITAVRNLLATGFSVPQATELLQALADKAALNRKGYADIGSAVVAASQGIEYGNTKMAEAAGTTERLTSMLKDAGIKTSELGNLQSDAAARQAILNGVLQNSAGNYGDLAKVSNTFQGEQMAASNAVQNFEISLGGVAQVIGMGILPVFTNFLGAHQQMATSMTAATIVAGGLTTAIFGIGVALQYLDTAMLMDVVTSPLFLGLTALAALAGVVVYNAVDKLQGKVKEMNNNLAAGSDGMNQFAHSTDNATAAQNTLADKLAQINEQINRNNQDYMEQLASTIAGIEDKADSLKQQIDRENQTYADAQAKNLDQYKTTMDSMSSAHEKRIDTLQKQLDQETALGKWANQSKLADIKEQITDENDQYNQQLSDKQTTYNQDVANQKQAHDQKVADLQKQLDQENALLQKHAADVAAVRNVQMLDEIDKIKQTHDYQIEALDKEKQKAIESAQQTVSGINNAYQTGFTGAQGNMANIGSTLGHSMGSAFKDALGASFVEVSVKIVDFFEQAAGFLKNSIDLNPLDWFKGSKAPNANKSLLQIWNDAAPRASGGSVSSGQPYLVGDNPDGSVNSTTELFVPSQSGTILSAPQTQQLLGGRGGNGGVTIYQTNHNYSQMDYESSLLELGWRIMNA